MLFCGRKQNRIVRFKLFFWEKREIAKCKLSIVKIQNSKFVFHNPEFIFHNSYFFVSASELKKVIATV